MKLLIALLVVSVDAANLRASERRLAGHGGHADGDDPEWHHKNRGPEYDCALTRRGAASRGESSASRELRFGRSWLIFSCLRVSSLFTRRASAACMSGVVIA